MKNIAVLRIFCSAIPLGTAGCASLSSISYPSDFHQYEELRSFRAPPIEQIPGHSIRLTWHAWHKKPALILANCAEAKCRLELRFTDGYGTYRQGKLEGVRQVSISKREFDVIAISLEEGGFDDLPSDLRENRNASLEPDSDGNIAICIHSPSYYLETFENGRRQMIYRYCQNNYEDGLRLAIPLIELAEEHFGKEMSSITAVWIDEERKGEAKSQ